MPLRGALRKKIEDRKENTEESKSQSRDPIENKQRDIQKRIDQLKKDAESLKRKPPQQEARPVQIIYHESKVDWILDILTIIFVVGVLLNTGLAVGDFSRLPSFAAMQSWLLFAVLFQLIKIGRKL